MTRIRKLEHSSKSPGQRQPHENQSHEAHRDQCGHAHPEYDGMALTAFAPTHTPDTVRAGSKRDDKMPSSKRDQNKSGNYKHGGSAVSRVAFVCSWLIGISSSAISSLAHGARNYGDCAFYSFLVLIASTGSTVKSVPSFLRCALIVGSLYHSRTMKSVGQLSLTAPRD